MNAHRRRSRSPAVSEEDEGSRPSTSNSTAPNDSKRLRRSYSANAANPSSPNHEDDASESVRRSAKSQRSNMWSDHRSLQKSVAGSSNRPPHQPGAIVRVKLTNFVTYTSAEFFPGPNLNMVIGPNGTGKSTLVCAICLGLGWGTQYLGRAKDVAEFVKHGCREAVIEIELQRATRGDHRSRTNPIITRNIRREGNKSSFTLNGSQSSGKAVMALAQSFNIQIDNLCQFLPQDKVVEFAQMTPIQILQSTQKAASSPRSLKYHETLVELRNNQKAHSNDNKGAREQLTNLEGRQEMQRIEVERLRERVIIQKQLTCLERCRPIPRFSDARQRAKHARNQQKELTADLKKLKQESGPTLKMVTAKQTYCKSIKEAKKEFEKEVKRAENECKRIEKNIENLENDMRDCDMNIQAERNSVGGIKQNIAREKIKLAQYLHQKESPPADYDYEAVNQEITDKKVQIRELQAKREELRELAVPLRSEGQAKKQKHSQLKEQLEKLDTETGQQESKLEEVSKETYRAWQWIQQNQNLFQKRVYGPPIIECSLTEPTRAKQIEALFQANDFRIITAQCREDFRLLQQELVDRMRLSDISLRVCTLDSLETFKPPLRSDQMQAHGLSGWALDYMRGPSTVVAMLCQERSLHQTGIIAKELTSQQYKDLEESNVKTCVSHTAMYRFVRRAEYGAAGVTSDRRDLRNEAKFWSGQNVDHGRKAHIQAQMKELEVDMTSMKTEIKRLAGEDKTHEADIKELNDESERLSSEKAEHQKVWVAYQGLDARIASTKEKIDRDEETIASVKTRVTGHLQKKDEAMFIKAETAIEYVDVVHELRERHKEQLELEVMLIAAQNDYDILSARNQHIVDLIRQKEADETKAGETARVATELAKSIMEQIKQIKAESDALDAKGDTTLRDLLQDVGGREGFTENDLDILIEIEQAKLNLTEGGDSNIIKEYEERAKKIEKLRSKVAVFASKQKDFINAINEIRQNWEPELDVLVSKISDAFGDSFARIGCAGQVAIHKSSSEDPVDCTEEMGGAENGLDFENWAIHISVKFRENEPLHLLDSHRQSGGERAVSTIFYLMALQSLSRAPFRVVDEINQGMDPRNERMVHGRMVDIAAPDEQDSRTGSQYFLITPKLLSGLKYKPGMTVLCIVSGENMPNAGDTRKKDENGKWFTDPGKSIDFGAFARRARELGLNTMSNTRTDSGVGITSSISTPTPTPVTSQATEVGA